MNLSPGPIPSTWTRVCGIEILAGKFSAVWAAYSRQTDVVTLYDEYQAPLSALPVHAEAINQRSSWRSLGAEKPGSWIPALFDLDAEGSQKREGRLAMASRLAALAINLADVPLDSEVALADVNARAETGRLKIWTTMAAWLQEYRTYRRDEEGKLPEGFGLMRATGLCLGPGLGVAVSENTATSDQEGYDYGDRTRNASTGY
jgi:hypothetical protein